MHNNAPYTAEINWSRAAIVARAHFWLSVRERFFSIIIMNVYEIGVYVCVRAELMLHYDQQHLIAAGSRADVNYTNTLSHSGRALCLQRM